MSVQAMSWALYTVGPMHPELDPGARMVLVVLADQADHEGRGAAVGVPTIGRAAGISRATVYRRLAELQDAGLIRPGDEQTVAHIAANRRPRVWDLGFAPAINRRLFDSDPGPAPVDNSPIQGSQPETPTQIQGSQSETPSRLGVSQGSHKPPSRGLTAETSPKYYPEGKDARVSVRDDGTDVWDPEPPPAVVDNRRGGRRGQPGDSPTPAPPPLRFCGRCRGPMLDHHVCPDQVADPAEGAARARQAMADARAGDR